MEDWEVGWRTAPFKNLENRTAPDLWPNNPEWVIRYTHHAMALNEAARALAADDDDAAISHYENLGDGSRGIWRTLDPRAWSTPAEAGRALAELLVGTVTALLDDTNPRIAADLTALTTFDEVVLGWNAEFAGPSSERRRDDFLAPYGMTQRTARDRIWHRGLAARTAGQRLQAGAVPALIKLTAILDDAVAQLSVPEVDVDPARPFAGLVPADLEAVYMSRATDMVAYRERLLDLGVGSLGITADGLTDIYGQALPRLGSAIRDGRSMLVVGPTSTGKTDIGRTAVANTVFNKRKAIVLLPTKALVAQAAEEWAEFFAGAPSTRDWQIVEASRDYPYNDERVAKGDYNILLAIPEKVAAYLAGGSGLLNQCGIIVVDELQTLGSRQRGPNIESLLTVIKANYPELPLLALSAPLADPSIESIAKWWVKDLADVVRTTTRPVPLKRYAFNRDVIVGKGLDGTPEHLSRQSSADPALWADDLHPSVRKFSEAIALVSDLLKRTDSHSDSKSVLVFTGSRDHAERVAKAIQVALEAEGVPAGDRRDPRKWRYAAGMNERDADGWTSALLHLPDLPATNDVIEGLVSGVMYHSARLDPEHRRIVENAYNKGLIRVIVATATLAIGLNLPADFVVIADVSEATPESTAGGRQRVRRLLDHHEVAQRLGRCGRLGRSVKGFGLVGEAYVLAPELNEGNLGLTEEQVTTIFDVIKKPHPEDPRTATKSARRQLRDPEVLFAALVDGGDTGEDVRSTLTDRHFARLLLQDVSRGAKAYTPGQLKERTRIIYEHSLLRAEGSEPFEIADLVDLLEEQELIGHPDDDDELWKVTGLGRTVALSNLPIENAGAIRRTAIAALEGAGPLTVLGVAAGAPHLKDLNWITLPTNDDVLPDVRNKAWTMVRSLANTVMRKNARLKDRDWLDLLGDRDIVGEGRTAGTFSFHLDQRDPELRDTALVAHLRAAAAYLWMSGLPVGMICRAITKNTESTVRGRQFGVQAYPADVRDLCERLSYIVNAASELLRVMPHDGQHLVLRNMAEALQAGLPYQLAPLTWIKEPRIHRERLATLLSMRIAELDFNDLAGVLDRLNEPPPNLRPPARRAHANQAFTDEEKVAIIDEHQRLRRLKASLKLPPDLRERTVPSMTGAVGSTEFGDVALRLGRSRTALAHRSELATVLVAFGLDVTDGEIDGCPAMTVAGPSGGHIEVVVVVGREVDSRAVGRLRAEDRVVLAFGGISAGAEYELRDETLTGFSVMTPSVFLAALARVELRWSEYEGDEDLEQELARRVLEFFHTVIGPVELSDISIADAAGGMPPPPPM